MESVLRTVLCDLLQIEVPVIQGAIGGPWEVSARMIAAVSSAGGLGSISATLKAPEQIERQIAEVRELTDKPFAVNHTRRPFNEEAFRATLAGGPAVISFAQGDPGDLVDRAHDAGAKFMHQVTTVAQARIANRAGADVIIAQGGEAGGFGGTIGTMTLVPQVVDEVAPTPVVAAGGIADGRGLAAALMLGATGVNIGTRFLASVECAVSEEWKSLIVASESEDVVKIDFAESVVPPMTAGGWAAVPRSLRTGFIDEWNARLPEVAENAERLRAELGEAMRSGRAHRLIPLAGQTAGQIAEILPVPVIMRLLVEQAVSALLAWRPEAPGAS